MNSVANSSFLNKPIKINLNICMHIFYLFLYFYILYFFIYFFGAGPSSAHMGWARPSQPGPATGPSQWPGWAKDTRSARWAQLKLQVQSACVIKDGKRRKDANLPGAAAGWRRRRWRRPVRSGRQTLLPLLCSFFYVLLFLLSFCVGSLCSVSILCYAWILGLNQSWV